MRTGRFLKSLFACAASLALLSVGHGVAQQPSPPPGGSAAAAGDIADFFTKVGDQIYEDCIFELSQEQLEVQQALIEAYIKQGAPSAIARQFAVRQIRPPKLSPKCERIKNLSKQKPGRSGCGTGTSPCKEARCCCSGAQDQAGNPRAGSAAC